MPDLIDEILEKMSPSSLELLDQIEVEFFESRAEDKKLRRYLSELYTIELKRYMSDVHKKSEEFLRESQKYKFLLDICNEEIAKMKFPKSKVTSREKMKLYVKQIEDLEKKLDEVLKGVNAEEIFNLVQELSRKTGDLEIKKKQLMDEVNQYEGFPADLKEAENCIADMKDRIKKKEAMLE